MERRRFILCVTSVACLTLSFAADASDEAEPRVEFRLAQREPAEGLVKATVDGQPEPFYLLETVVATGDDVVEAKVVEDNRGKPAVNFSFSEGAAKRVGALTKKNLGKCLALMLDGKVVIAPTLVGPISDSVQIIGNFTPEEVARLVEAITSK